MVLIMGHHFLFTILFAIMCVVGLSNGKLSGSNDTDVIGNLSPREYIDGSTGRRLELVGSHGNKLYFSLYTSMNQDQSKTFCESNDMHLVSIDSESERTYLSTINPDQRFWTSAMDTGTYEWGTGAVVEFQITLIHRFCIILWGSFLIADDCTGEDSNIYYALCQVKTIGKE